MTLQLHSHPLCQGESGPDCQESQLPRLALSRREMSHACSQHICRNPAHTVLTYLLTTHSSYRGVLSYHRSRCSKGP